MKDFKVTKGKWVSRHNGNYWEVNREEDFNDGKRLAISVMVFNVADEGCVFNRSGEDKANAQLIAAAPELLQALQHTIRELRKLNSIGSMPIIEQSEYIISKALGKEADNEQGG